MPHNSLPERVGPLGTGVARKLGTEPRYPVKSNLARPGWKIGPCKNELQNFCGLELKTELSSSCGWGCEPTGPPWHGHNGATEQSNARVVWSLTLNPAAINVARRGLAAAPI